MQVRQEQNVDTAQRDFILPQPLGDAAPGIEQQILIAGDDQCRRPEPVQKRRRRTDPQHDNLEIRLVLRFDRSNAGGKQRQRYNDES